MRYLVMETHEAHAVVLDEKGAFIKVVNKGYEVGQYVDEIISFDTPLEHMEKKDKVHRFPVWRMTAVAACLCVMLVGFAQNNLMVYGKVHMQINPDVMVSLNKQQKVLAIEALNEDGEVLLADYNYRKKSLDIVVDELTTKAEELGFLASEREIHVELISKNDTWKQETRELVTSKLDEKYEQEVLVIVEEVKEEEIEPTAEPEVEVTVEESVPTESPKPKKERPTEEMHPELPMVEDGEQQMPPNREDRQQAEEQKIPEMPRQDKEPTFSENPREDSREKNETREPESHPSNQERPSDKQNRNENNEIFSSDPTFEKGRP